MLGCPGPGHRPLAMSPSVILYRCAPTLLPSPLQLNASLSYAVSPFCKKIESALLLKGVPHHYVDVCIVCFLCNSHFTHVQVAPLLPRPEITDVLGIAYRRLPILAIGRDVYCDSRYRHQPKTAPN